MVNLLYILLLNLISLIYQDDCNIVGNWAYIEKDSTYHEFIITDKYFWFIEDESVNVQMYSIDNNIIKRWYKTVPEEPMQSIEIIEIGESKMVIIYDKERYTLDRFEMELNFIALLTGDVEEIKKYLVGFYEREKNYYELAK